MSHKTSIATDSSSLHIFLLAYLSYLQNKSFKASRKDPTCLAAINGNGALRSPLCLGISAQMLCEPPVLTPHQHVPILQAPLALGGCPQECYSNSEMVKHCVERAVWR